MDEQNNTPYLKVPVSEFLERVYDKQEKLADSVHEINITLSKQHISLEEHMRRSKASEEAIQLLRTELKPIERHVEIVKFVVKVAAGILSSASVLYIIKALIK